MKLIIYTLSWIFILSNAYGQFPKPNTYRAEVVSGDTDYRKSNTVSDRVGTIEGVKHGTAFSAVHTQIIVTNAHNLVDFSQGNFFFLSPSHIKFWVGDGFVNKAKPHESTRGYCIHNDYAGGNHDKYDFAVLYSEDNYTTNHYEFCSRDERQVLLEKDEYKIYLYGYPTQINQTTNPTDVEYQCQVISNISAPAADYSNTPIRFFDNDDNSGTIVLFDLESAKGASGSPLLINSGQGAYKVIGILHAGYIPPQSDPSSLDPQKRTHSLLSLISRRVQNMCAFSIKQLVRTSHIADKKYYHAQFRKHYSQTALTFPTSGPNANELTIDINNIERAFEAYATEGRIKIDYEKTSYYYGQIYLQLIQDGQIIYQQTIRATGGRNTFIDFFDNLHLVIDDPSKPIKLKLIKDATATFNIHSVGVEFTAKDGGGAVKPDKHKFSTKRSLSLIEADIDGDGSADDENGDGYIDADGMNLYKYSTPTVANLERTIPISGYPLSAGQVANKVRVLLHYKTAAPTVHDHAYYVVSIKQDEVELGRKVTAFMGADKINVPFDFQLEIPLNTGLRLDQNYEVELRLIPSFVEASNIYVPFFEDYRVTPQSYGDHNDIYIRVTGMSLDFDAYYSSVYDIPGSGVDFNSDLFNAPPPIRAELNEQRDGPTQPTPDYPSDAFAIYHFDKNADDATQNTRLQAANSVAFGQFGQFGEDFFSPDAKFGEASFKVKPGNNNHDGTFAKFDTYPELSDGGPYTKRSVSFWVKLEESTGPEKAQILYGRCGHHRGIIVYYYNGQLYSGIYENQGSQYRLAEHGPLELGVWTHVAFVLDATDSNWEQDAFRVYLNGAKKDSVEGRSIGATTNYTPCIGGFWGALKFSPTHPIAPADGVPLRGLIDEFGIWTRALTDDEVAVLYDPDTAGNPGGSSSGPLSIVPKLSNEGAIAYFPFDDDTLDVYSNLTMNSNGAMLDQTRGFGRGALSVKDPADAAQIEDSALLNQGDIQERTISAWFMLNDVAGNQFIYEEGGRETGFNIYVSDGNLYAGAWDLLDAEWSQWVDLGEIEAGLWTHVALVFDSAEGVLSAYRDGGLIDTVNANQISLTGGGDMRVGIGGVIGETLTQQGGTDAITSHSSFNGYIDDLTIWSRALTNQEISTLGLLQAENEGSVAQSLVSKASGEDIVGWFPFDENASDIIENLDMTIVGAVIDKDKGFGPGSLALSAANDTGLIADHIDLNQLDPLNERTVSVWFHFNELAGRQVIYEEGDSTAGLVVYADDGALYAGVWDQTAAGDWPGTWLQLSQLEAGSWNQVVVVLDGANSIFGAYLNGVAAGVDYATGISMHEKVAVGGVHGTTLFHDGATGGYDAFNGNIDDLVIWNRAISAEEASELAGLITGDADFARNVLILKPSSTIVRPQEDGTVSVTLDISALDDLYGLQADLSFDANLMSVEQSSFGDYFDPEQRLEIGPTAGDGTWHGSISLHKPAPSVTGYKDGQHFATIVFNVADVPAGVVNIEGDVLFTGLDGVAYEGELVGTTITINNGINTLPGEGGTVFGNLASGGNNDVELVNLDTGVSTNVTTDENGDFSFIDLQAGNYLIRTDEGTQLFELTDQMIADGSAFEINDLENLLGDINKDGVVDIADFTLLAAHYDTANGDDDYDSKADLNTDGRIDIIDLTAMGSNFTVYSTPGGQ